MNPKHLELFTHYISKEKIMIVDSSTSSRSRLMKTFVDFGAKRNQIISVSSFQEAQEAIEEHQPQIVLADYKFKNGSGFELFSFYRDFAKNTEALLILVTSNTSQSVVAKAAEEDVDAFVLKPYTMTSLKESFVTAYIRKKYPTDYAKAIMAGKDKMFKESKLDEAEGIFNDALKLADKPTLARFYLGQIKYMRQQIDEAEKEYNEGLNANKIHYKCQIGLYELLMEQKKYDEAYEVVRHVIKYFPANPDRLKEVVRLAVVTRNYIDIEYLYKVFKDFENRDKEVVNYICSGLYTLGKYYLINNQNEKALITYNNVSISCAGMSKFYKAMISDLVEKNLHEGAKSIINRFEKEESVEYLISKYLATSFDLDINNKVSEGLNLYNQGIRDPICMKILLEALKELGDTIRYEKYLEEAAHYWPDLFSTIKGIAA